MQVYPETVIEFASDSPPSRPAVITWRRCGGPTDLSVPSVEKSKRGKCSEACTGVGAAATRCRSRQVRCSTIRTRTSVSRFEAIWYVTNQKLGVSALGLQRVLGLGSYHTAWNWLHKLRRAMVRPGRPIGWRAWLRLTRSSSAGSVLGSVAVGQPGKHWSSWRSKRTSDGLAASASVAWPTPLARASNQRSGKWSTPEVRVRKRTGGEATTDWLSWVTSMSSCVRTSRLGRQPPTAGESDSLAAEAVVGRHSSRSGATLTPGLLFGRVHIPVQSPNLDIRGASCSTDLSVRLST